MKATGDIMEKNQLVERSIIKKFRKEIYSKFIKAISNYQLINEEDNIMVCISGGKDSFLMAKCFQEIIKHGNFSFKASYVVMNPGYNKKNLELIKSNAKLLNIPIEIFETPIFEIVNGENGGKSPCYLCARMRRVHLYNKAVELGCNKIALGHDFNDFIETTLLSIFYGAEVKTMMPKLHSDNFKGIELIRPMCYIKEKDIISWAKYNDLLFLNCACRFTENLVNNPLNSGKRKEIKDLITSMEKVNPSIENNIYKALENVNLNCIIGGHKDDNNFSFLDTYDNE